MKNWLKSANNYFCTNWHGVSLDENLSWKEHMEYHQNKIAATMGLMQGAKSFLDK